MRLVTVLLAFVLLTGALVVPASASHKHGHKMPSIEHRIKREVANNWRLHYLRREVRAVIWCESRDNPRARNGQYYGLAQMGSYERQITDWGWLIWKQIRGMRRYWEMTGRDWGAWTCQP